MQDIPELAHYFLRRLDPGSSMRFSDDVGPTCSQDHGIGNVRELQHAVEAAAVLCRGGILSASHFRSVETTGPLPLHIRQCFETERVCSGMGHAASEGSSAR